MHLPPLPSHRPLAIHPPPDAGPPAIQANAIAAVAMGALLHHGLLERQRSLLPENSVYEVALHAGLLVERPD